MLNLLILFIKLLTLILLYFMAAYVILCGKSKTGINSDFAITATILVAVLIIL